LNQEEQRRFLDILQYWHKVEFFIPFALDQRLGDLEDWQWRYLDRDVLASAMDASWRHFDPPADKEVQGFNLYLGVFDKSAILAMMRHCLPLAAQDGVTDEEEQRADLDGDTCFAKLELSVEGSLQLDEISVSTAPWAIGQVRAGGLQALQYEAFDTAKQRLQRLLGDFMSQRGVDTDSPLGAQEVARLHRLLCDWAGFQPDPGVPMAMLEVRVRDKAAAADPAVANPVPEKPVPGAEPPTGIADEGDEDDEDDAGAELEIDILNSFFIVDIERAIASVQAGVVPETLRRYLTPLPAAQRIDLYSDAGRARLLQALQPQHLNAGHWLTNPAHAMSLMQQFAINTALADLADGGLFSVNGPPGTGKTTLLRDLFAENLVRRARVLAGLPDAGAAFVGPKRKVMFNGDPDACYLQELIEPLLGYEMVVTSYNNAAIENISIELPKRGEVDAQWRDKASYLQPVAHNLAIRTGKRRNESPEGKDMPWGLISCALGNARNRKTFRARFGFAMLETSSAETPRNFWNWSKQALDVDFIQAATRFREADQAVAQALSLRSDYAACLDRLRVVESERDRKHRESEQAREVLAQAEQEFAARRDELARLEATMADLQEHALLLRQTRPSLLQWLSGFRAAIRTFRMIDADLQANAVEQLRQRRARDRLRGHIDDTLQPACALARARADACQAALAELDYRRGKDRERIEMLARVLPEPRLPQTLQDLEKDEFQIQGLWHDAELAQLRSQLFAAAMTLHEAWLYEVSQKGKGFGSNVVAITKWLANKRPEKEEDYLAIMRSLFMIVPIVSTTFASFANQFRGIGPGGIGWLFIDEAGQAVPQAAVGALWRAQRAVVVGDPLQIEPVFTLPTRLIAALSALSVHTSADDYSPHRVSVQRLADQANRHGALAKMGSESLWIGSPLRVHRRCIEPMFGIANRIAYEGKMVYGQKARHAPDAPPLPVASCWLDVPGRIQHKQVVPEQIAFVVELIGWLYQRDQALPPLYVISPFKAIRQELHDALHAYDWKSVSTTGKALTQRELGAWLRSSVGTVHTFQGKEQDTVVMVLGADPQHPGSPLWASSKPNLLNVALTRAKRRCYLVGDFELWSSMRYFDATVAGEFPLQRRTGREFMTDLRQAR